MNNPDTICTTIRAADIVPPTSPSNLPPIVSAVDLMAEEFGPPTPVIHGVLNAGCTMVYGGASKTNKTFALMDLAISVASGKEWMHFNTERGKVVYIDLELQRREFKNRLDAIRSAKAKLFKDIHPGNVDVWPLRGHAKDISDLMDDLESRLRGKGYRLVIIDPIYKLLGDRDENAAGDINSLMNDLDKLAVRTGAAIVIGHHFSKGGQAGRNSIDRMSGSGVFARSPDALMTITKHEADNVFTVEPTLRNHRPIDPFCVEWDYPLMTYSEGKYDPKKLKSPGVKKEQFTSDQLLKTLGDQELSCKDWKKQVIDAHGMSPRTFAEKKNVLFQKGRIIEAAGGKWKKVTINTRVDALNIPPPIDQSAQQQPNDSAAKT